MKGDIMAKKPSTKDKIITAAWQLFREKGYNETTIEDIIEKSDTSKGTFYHYFVGKDALLSSLSTIFDSYYEEYYPTLDPEMNRVDMLITLCQNVHKMIGEDIQINVLSHLYSSQVVTKGDKHLLDRNRFYYRMIQTIAEEGIRRGEIDSSLTVTDVTAIYTMCERAIIYDYCISDGSFDLGEYTCRMIPVLLAGIRAK